LSSLALAVLSAFAAGCGTRLQSQADDAQRAALADLGQAYRLYLEQKKQPPTGPANLRAYTPAFALLPQALQGDKFTVLWGANPASVPNPADTVLAYEKGVPASGGCVLMADGNVKHMTAQEFQNAPKAAGR
jgi:hypothetical protein